MKVKYKIFFDESNKLDKVKKYSYYGAIGIDEDLGMKITEEVTKILDITNKNSEFHFTEYKNDRELQAYLYCLHHFVKTEVPINIFVVNNKKASEFAENASISLSELRNLFYVKIPERLFYGLTRRLPNKYREVKIIVDYSPEYGRFRVYSKLKQQMNAHAIYRGMKYYVNKATHQESHNSIILQIVDLLIGIVVFIMEKSYLNTNSLKSMVKSDLIYRFLIEEDNLALFQNQVNIFKWNGLKDRIVKLNIAEYLSEFIIFKTKFDMKKMIKINHIRDRFDTTKAIRKELGYGNNQLRMLLGLLDQLNGKDRNEFVMQQYHKYFK